MNIAAYDERERNREFITTFRRESFLVFEVETSKVRYQGKFWPELTDYEKRKFENAIVLENPKERIKVIYH